MEFYQCPNKKCKRHRVLINISAVPQNVRCSECKQQLKRSDYKTDQMAPSENISTTDTPPATRAQLMGQSGPTQETKETTKPDTREWVSRKHNTFWDKKKNAWVCWCGAEGGGNGWASQHDNLPEELVPLDSMKDGTYTKKPTQTDDWSAESCEVEGCPIMREPASKPRIEIPHKKWLEFLWLTKRFDTEWLIYLIGETVPPSEANPGGGWKVTDTYIPKQKVTKSHVTVDEAEILALPPGVIGDVHSHVGMGAFFSQEDKKHFNHDVHIVVNNRGEFVTAVRATLKCGRFSRVEAKIMLRPEPNETDVEEQLFDKLEEETFQSKSEGYNPSKSYHSGPQTPLWSSDNRKAVSQADGDSDDDDNPYKGYSGLT